MNEIEHFAITKSLQLLKQKVDEAFRYVRSDSKGNFHRTVRDAMYSEILALMEFIDKRVEKK